MVSIPPDDGTARAGTTGRHNLTLRGVLCVEGGWMKFVAVAVALLVAACSGNSTSPPGDLGTSNPPPSASTVAESAPVASATPSRMVESPSWPPQPARDEHYVGISKLTLSEDRRRIELGFVGAREYASDDPCSADYTATTAVVDGVLEIGVTGSYPPRPTEPWGCDDLGYDRHLEVSLDEPFIGTVWRDLAGYRHFLAPPDGLVELTGLPAGWELRAGRDVEDSPTGRWERSYSPDPTLADKTKRVDLYQSFDGPVNVTGDAAARQVTVNGQPATLYRSSSTGELVLVWRLGNDGLALVAYEQEFSIDQLIDLAESASTEAPLTAARSPWGPLAVLPAQDGMDTLAAGGPLRITDTCVYLEAHGLVYLLFWHADQVTWNEESRTITFENFPWNDSGRIVTLRDGDNVVVGGSGGGDEEGGESSEQFVRRMDWVAPPASSCKLDPWWSVGAVDTVGS